MKRELPKCAYLHECFHLDTENWLLIRKQRPRHHFERDSAYLGWNRYAGTVCRGRNGGELSVGLDGRTYLQKHIVFKMVTGRYAQELEYKDGNFNNLDPNNLQETTKVQTRAKFVKGTVILNR